ncbi:MAG: NAD-dependent epimerase/dehydratase family protein [Micrococcales bacterium]|nr:NAD-dependent epimerase/dehydratase family protein [Micrococcales bacterium]
MSHRALVIGAGGLLGRHVVAGLRAGGLDPEALRVPWSDTDESIRVLAAALSGLSGADTWDVYWCAGAGVVATAAEDLEQEVAVFRAALAALPRAGGGALFLASSAGGVYAGSGQPPFTESTDPRPITAYGHAKLAMETIAAEWAADTGGLLLVGRISNLYGPGQNLAKNQGLISAVVKAQLTGEPFVLGVPEETARDYLYAADAAAMAVAGMRAIRGRAERTGERQVTKILCTGRSATIRQILDAATHRLGAPVPVRRGEARVGQVLDLAMRSQVWPELDAQATTDLAEGISAVHDDIERQLGDKGRST